jgi:hypothetical protein
MSDWNDTPKYSENDLRRALKNSTLVINKMLRRRWQTAIFMAAFISPFMTALFFIAIKSTWAIVLGAASTWFMIYVVDRTWEQIFSKLDVTKQKEVRTDDDNDSSNKTD